ncbi:hypothetical protein [Nocardia gipuzkoensis]|uniref:hypothetical protein n=1 Tax=Nocardia gipuzkoensis TaxID=2749991 RepID=UPI00237E1F87|nr:hypothetical protein [Nocardia gipuzkoensis]MDE1672694.1 hypothetical protein [Nocardia gipuzkoensis]
MKLIPKTRRGRTHIEFDEYLAHVDGPTRHVRTSCEYVVVLDVEDAELRRNERNWRWRPIQAVLRYERVDGGPWRLADAELSGWNIRKDDSEGECHLRENLSLGSADRAGIEYIDLGPLTEAVRTYWPDSTSGGSQPSWLFAAGDTVRTREGAQGVVVEFRPRTPRLTAIRMREEHAETGAGPLPQPYEVVTVRPDSWQPGEPLLSVAPEDLTLVRRPTTETSACHHED